MARHLYAPLFVQLAGTAAPAPNLPFRIWSDLTAGTDVTSQCVTTDATAAYNATTDTQGNIAPFRGPDGYVGTLFADTGAAYRFHLYSPTLIADLITGVANAGAGGGGGGTALTSYVNQVASLLDYPTAFPPTSHTHSSNQINDSTTTGRSLITASSADAALTTVGGVKNSGGVTSLRTVTSTTAALSNGVPTLPVVSGQILFVYSG